jgi:hypothetical protein
MVVARSARRRCGVSGVECGVDLRIRLGDDGRKALLIPNYRCRPVAAFPVIPSFVNARLRREGSTWGNQPLKT